MNSNEERIKKLLKEVLQCSDNLNDLDPKENLANIGVNSITFIKLIVSIEIEFGIEVEDDNLAFDKMDTLQSIVNYIETRVNI